MKRLFQSACWGAGSFLGVYLAHGNLSNGLDMAFGVVLGSYMNHWFGIKE